MPKPSASNDNMATALANTQTTIDFNEQKTKDLVISKERIQHQYDHAKHHLVAYFSNDPSLLRKVTKIFSDAEVAAAMFDKNVIGSPSSSNKRQPLHDLDTSDDSDDEDAPITGKGKKKMKDSQGAAKVPKDNGLSGMNLFMASKINRDLINDELGYGGPDCMSTLRHCWEKFEAKYKDQWQRLAYVANKHHKDHRAEVEKFKTGKEVNAELNRLFDITMSDPNAIAALVSEWEENDVQERKVMLPPPELIKPHDGPDCGESYTRTDGSVIDYTVVKKINNPKSRNHGKEYTEQSEQNARYERMLERKKKKAAEKAKVAAGNALAAGDDQ